MTLRQRTRAAGIAALAVAAAIRTRGRLGRVLTGLRRGLAILGHPRAYALRVAAPQTLASACRVAGMACFLGAFHISGGLGVAALALVAGSITTVVPLTPGGVGTQQALLVVLLAPVASPAAAISFSLGSQLVMTTVNVVLGGTCMGVMLGTMPWRARIGLADHEPTPVPVPIPVPVPVPVQPGD